MPCQSEIVVPGHFLVFLGTASNPNNLQEVGEMRDSLTIRFEELINPIKGDSRGGDAGHEIEQQFLGMKGRATLEFSRWNKTVMQYFETSGGILPKPGFIPNHATGALKLKDHSFRLLFYPLRDQSRLKNFVCCACSSPHVIGGGTKYEAAILDLEFHRAPCGHYKENYIYDTDITGLPSTIQTLN